MYAIELECMVDPAEDHYVNDMKIAEMLNLKIGYPLFPEKLFMNSGIRLEGCREDISSWLNLSKYCNKSEIAGAFLFDREMRDELMLDCYLMTEGEKDKMVPFE